MEQKKINTVGEPFCTLEMSNILHKNEHLVQNKGSFTDFRLKSRVLHIKNIVNLNEQ